MDLSSYKNEKKEDIDKLDYLNYFIVDRISRNYDSPRFKNSKIQCDSEMRNPSFDSTLNQISTYSIEKIKPKFDNNNYLSNEESQNKISSSVINHKKKSQHYIKDNLDNLHDLSNIKISNIFLNTLREEKPNDKSVENEESVNKVQNGNPSYCFGKSYRESSNNYKLAKNIFNELIKRKGLMMNKLKLMKKLRQNINNETIIFQNLEIKHLNDKKKILNNSKNYNKDFENRQVTSFLNRKNVNNIPLTFPLCLSHKIRYNSISEKNRAENILNKFICLKTHIVNDPSNTRKIIKEFIIKNTNINIEQLSKEKIKNFYNFLKITFSFNPNKTLKEIIYDAMNYNKNLNKQKINPYIFMRNDFKYNIINNKTDNIKLIKNHKELKKSNSTFSTSFRAINEKMFADLNNKSFDIKKKNKKVLLQDLESELNKIKNYHLVQPNLPYTRCSNNSTKYNNCDNKISCENDKNNNMKNICLLNRRISQKYKSLYKDFYNNNNNNKIGVKKSLKKINERMYYKNIRKNIFEEYDTEEIKKKCKLTEYIVLQRTRQALLLQKEKEKCSDIFGNKFFSKL